MTAVLSNSVFRPVDPAAVGGAFLPPLADVVGADERVSLLDGSSVLYANFDYAASAPALRAVADGLLAALPQYASVHRGAGALSQITTHRYEQARETIRRFVRARADDHVVFTRNTTDSINLLAHCLGERGGDVVVLDIEHHANLLPWQRLPGTRLVTACATIEETLAALEDELAATPAALLAITAASNVTGEVLPVTRLASIAHRHGARILIDGAQLVAHQPVSVVSHGIDYLVFSGHKLYAPFGSGVLVGRGDWLDEASPYLAGGGASAEVASGGRAQWHTGPARHEAGSPNVLGAVSIADACTALSDIGFDAIGHHGHALRERLDAGLSVLDGVRPLRIFTDSAGRVGIAGFAVDGFSARTVACYLSDHHGIGVRDGRFCAHPLLTRLGYPAGAVRASFGLGTGVDDVDRLLNALSELVSRRGTIERK
ncbi:aminotransferase class V-fold PLP-dependent enzyme [Gordonia pseudamarae]|jgi:selenocysteine lyase/cysteine desulfurase|uniref:Aminotransferase class V-fold PLP-dependent enzyme n=1 Tax=Gordonia pseudamarae TaxID=2831662 RepID=A0ABX6IE46_9ACTN|nr:MULTISPECIES: aminotransferase class V-fold PLP-dependent enzyme [Gordonia]MBD0021506.1 aminotransferase class V-fold PLP-dependent enzyme [Gordonia sp. (in: high G+C Gram-positive bacteria)]QHN25194.1 aminotransferase class V-fold PLP-dependent enzyme [Gordonia pseudamarae]QHN34126.1 aminotransferase class V-fold PLP-dependent enzyme [Gordonia pseudamarae]